MENRREVPITFYAVKR